MPFTVPPAGTTTKFSDLHTALNFSGNPQTKMSLFYSSSLYTASAWNDTNCLMYHNLAMGVGAVNTAKQSIYDNLNALSNLNLGNNWGSYTPEPNIILTFNLSNNNPNYDVNITLYLSDGTTNYQFYNTTLLGAAVPPQASETNYNTNVLVSTINSKYEIVLDASAFYAGIPPGPGLNGNTTTASDTDNVGGGTIRTANGPSSFNEFTPLSNFVIVRGDNNSTRIALNKRTTFNVTFN